MFSLLLTLPLKIKKEEFKAIKLLFIKDAFNLSKVTIKTLTMLQNISVSNKCSSFELSIHQRIMKKINNGRNY